MADKLSTSIVIALAHTQIQLEVMDDVKETVFYRHRLKKTLNQLERELESILKGEVGKAYIENDIELRNLGLHIQYITKWISKSSFEDIIKMGRAMNEDNIKFSEDE